MVQELFLQHLLKVALQIRLDSIMSVAVPRTLRRCQEAANASEVPYSYVGSNSEMDQAIGSITASLDDLLKLAKSEDLQLIDEIKNRNRRISGLVSIPQIRRDHLLYQMKA